MRFEKWQGLGNDYLIVEEEELPAVLDAPAVGLLCDRHLGVGGDGILVRETPTGRIDGAVARLRIYNPDGSQPEMCGNGIRMFARYLSRRGAVSDGEFVVETPAGPIVPRLMDEGLVRVHMGRARFRSDGIGGDVGAGLEDVVAQELEALGARYRFTFVDVGNPHCVIVVEDVHDLPLEVVGPAIEHLPLFPNRVNVEFVQVEDDGSVTMRVWERGVGETQACGTGATAVGVAAVRLGLADSPVSVHLPGGDLVIEPLSDWQVFMTGPAERVYAGELSEELRARLGWAVHP